MRRRLLFAASGAAAIALVSPAAALFQDSIDCGGRRWAVDNLGLRLTNAESSWEYWAFGPPAQRRIVAQATSGRSATLYAFGATRQQVEQAFGLPANQGTFLRCATIAGAALHQSRGWWPVFAIVPTGNEPWMEGQDVALSLSPDYNGQQSGRARIEAWLHALPGDDLIRWQRDLLVVSDATPATATSLLGPDAPNPQTLNGLARTIAEDFAARGIARLDAITATADDENLTFNIRARAADGTRHNLTYSGPMWSLPASAN